LALHGIHELLNRSLAAKEKRSVFLSKVKKPAVRTDGGADSGEVLSKIWTGFRPADGFT
jgi:hypothetical protein